MDDQAVRIAHCYMELAKSARERFDSRREVEWKVTVALWTIFGAATGAAITARVWVPAWWLVILISIFVIILVLTYRTMWLRYMAEAFRRDHLTSYYWESGVQMVICKRLPYNLDPGYEIQGEEPVDRRVKKLCEWIRMEDCPEPNMICGGQISKRLHNSQKSQFWITVVFAFVFILVLIGKAATGEPKKNEARSSDDSVIFNMKFYNYLNCYYERKARSSAPPYICHNARLAMMIWS